MIHGFRVFLYILLSIFSAVVMLLCAFTFCSHDGAYVFTEVTSLTDTGTRIIFDYRVDVELLLTSILSVVWSFLIGWTIYKRIERHYVNTFSAELVGLLFFFLLWVFGATFGSLSPGYETHYSSSEITYKIQWGPSCWVYSTCRVLTATFVFAWVSSIVVLALFITSFLFASANKAFRDPLHGRWDRRAMLRGLMLMRNSP
ncbi:hypothetical protein EDC04DRAFT_161522 [Pisolithus marmoratus]|nr:hypothetical protein EDC04DRAFT_161522 [Pisolithus marmoratus]